MRRKEEAVNERVTFSINNTEYSASTPEEAIRELAYTLETKYDVPREAQVHWLLADVEVRDAQEERP